MTKEEILKEACSVNPISGKGFVVTYPAAAIDAAMNQYAEQLSIAFAEWIDDQLNIALSRIIVDEDRSIKWMFYDQRTSITTAELYQVFLESQNK